MRTCVYNLTDKRITHPCVNITNIGNVINKDYYIPSELGIIIISKDYLAAHTIGSYAEISYALLSAGISVEVIILGGVVELPVYKIENSEFIITVANQDTVKIAESLITRALNRIC